MPKTPPTKSSMHARRMRGFERASGLLAARVRKVGESRGFEVAKLLTHWEEVIGVDLARCTRPVDVSYSRGGFGATLTVLTTGASAPMVQMQTQQMMERVNAVYGYGAIRRIRVTQTAPTGFAEGQAQFAPAPKAEKPGPSAEHRAKAAGSVSPVEDEGLRQALELLGANILSRKKAN